MFTNDDLFIDEPIAPVPQQDGKVPFAECWRCPLKDAPCVPTHRPQASATLVVVGEAPGYYEVKQGKPFVGPSGQLLDYVLDQVGIDPLSVVKTNAVLCKAPDNDVPQAAIQACQKRLHAEIANYPDVPLVTLGKTPYSALHSQSNKPKARDGILKARGSWQTTTAGREFMPTLHPAFVLRSPGYYNSLLNDFRALTIDRSKDWLQTEYHIVNNYPVALDLYRSKNAKFAYDVETTGLNAHNDALICLAIAINPSDPVAYVFDKNSVLRHSKLLQYLFDHCKPIAHNGKFDNHVLARYGINVTQADDTMLAHYALDETKGTHGLKQLATTYLGVPDYESELVDKHFRVGDREKRDYGKIPREDLYKYVAIDACATLALNDVLQPLIDQDNVREAYNILIDASNALQLAERKGIKIDRPYLEKVLTKLTDAIEAAELAVQKDAAIAAQTFLNQIGTTKWQAWLAATDWCKTIDQYRIVVEKIAYGYEDKAKKVTYTGVNLNSWQQLQVLLYDILGLTHQKVVGFKTKPRSTNAEALDALAPLNHPFVKILQEFRRLDKIRSTYVEPLLRMADTNDRIHVNFLLHGTETGRLSASDSLHGIPRPSDIWGQAIRGAFIADEGKKLIIADYSQAELRCFAAESKEPFLLNIFNMTDEEAHNVAITMFGALYTKLDYNNPRAVGYRRTVQDVHDRTTILLAEKQNDDRIKHAIEYREWHESDWEYFPYAQYHTNEVFTHKAQKTYLKEVRTRAKNVNFGGLVYLGGASGIAAMIRAQTGNDISEKQIQPVLDLIKSKMPIARQWQTDQFAFAKKYGYVQSRFGNKRRFPLITDDTLDEIRKASVNAVIQNEASQLTLLSAIELTRLGCDVLHLVHDSIIIECNTQGADRVKDYVEHTMITIGTRYFPEVKWSVDVEIVDRWYDDRPSF